MKTNLKRLLAFFLCVSLCVNAALSANAANENNSQGVVFSASLDKPTLYVSNTDQEVTMTVSTNKAVTVDGIGGTFVWDKALAVKSIGGADERINFESGDYNIVDSAKAILTWSASDSENIADVKNIAKVTFTVPANTPAGTYKVGMEAMELTSDYGDIWENEATVTATLTIAEPTKGYSAEITTLTPAISVGEAATVSINIGHDTDTHFAAGEVKVQYDKARLSFNREKSTLGTASVKDLNGIVTLEDYGADKALGKGVYVLVFDAIKDGNTGIQLQTAAFINKANAVKADLETATITQNVVTFEIAKRTFAVTMPDIFDGNTVAVEGEDYTFTVEQNYGYLYNYDSVEATVNGVPAEVIDNEDGTYTVKGVTGPLSITANRTPKSFTVTFEGDGAADIDNNQSLTATYTQDYTFAVPHKDDFAYKVESITINGQPLAGFNVTDDHNCTIPGMSITGPVVINISKVATTTSVEVHGNAVGVVQYDPKADLGESYTFSITPEAGYEYSVTATMGGTTVVLGTNEDKTVFTIDKVTGNIVITVTAAVVVDKVEVSEYLAVDGLKVWLVTNTTTLAEGKIPTYDGNAMFWSDAYQAYCYLVIATDLQLADAQAKVDIVAGTVVNVSYDMDVNKTGKVDASDAQLIHNIYNVAYSQFDTDATVEKFLRADVNKDKMIDMKDPAAVIAHILAQ